MSKPVKDRPLFPNHIEKIATIKQRQKDLGTREYSSDVLSTAEHLGIKQPIMTCAQRDNKYTKHNMYGVELEISTDLSATELVDCTDYPFFIIKKDSSIARCRNHSLEVVGVPATLKANSILWSRWAEKVIDKCENDLGRIGGRDGTNGMHVHVARDNFIDTRHLRNFLVFMNAPWHVWFIFQMSDRVEYNNLERWAKPCTMQAGVAFNRWVKDISTNCRAQDKYAFTNMRHSSTVEVRIFQGDLSAASIVKNLQFVDSVVEFTKERSAATCDLKYYMKWLESTDKNRYQELKQFLTQIDWNGIWEEFKFWKFLYKVGKPAFAKKMEGQKVEIKSSYNTGLWDRVCNARLNTSCTTRPVGEEETDLIIVAEFKKPKTTRLFSHHKTTVNRYSRIRSFVSEAA